MSDVIKDLSELRLTYQKGELHEAEVDTQPHEQFLSWFNYALQAGLHEPYAMSLATANAQGDHMCVPCCCAAPLKQVMTSIPP